MQDDVAKSTAADKSNADSKQGEPVPSNNMTNLLEGLEEPKTIDEFIYRATQTYEEVQEVKRFFSADKVKRAGSPEAGQGRLRMD